MMASDKGVAPRERQLPEARPTGRMGTLAVDTVRLHLLDRDDVTVQAHYCCLERPCACLEGWVFITFKDENGVERTTSYRCRRCADAE